MAGEVFFAVAAWELKRAWDKIIKEDEEKMTPEQLATWRKEPVWLKNYEGTWLAEDRTFVVTPHHSESYQGQPIPDLKVCECGVGIVGGLHSDWCPVKDER